MRTPDDQEEIIASKKLTRGVASTFKPKMYHTALSRKCHWPSSKSTRPLEVTRMESPSHHPFLCNAQSTSGSIFRVYFYVLPVHSFTVRVVLASTSDCRTHLKDLFSQSADRQASRSATFKDRVDLQPTAQRSQRTPLRYRHPSRE
nr:hypothetical protein CFP56_01468 [Quercus suber]